MWKFHIYKDSGHRYRWRRRSSNGQIDTAAEIDNAQTASVEDDG